MICLVDPVPKGKIPRSLSPTTEGSSQTWDVSLSILESCHLHVLIISISGSIDHFPGSSFCALLTGALLLYGFFFSLEGFF